MTSCRFVLTWALAALVACMPSVANSESCPDAFDVRALNRLASLPPSDGAAAGVHPAIAKLVSDVATIYACQGLINYYASKLGLPSNIVKQSEMSLESGLTLEFSNSIQRNVCGSVVYKTPKNLPGFDAANVAVDTVNAHRVTHVHNDLYKAIIGVTRDVFVDTQGRLATIVDSMITPFTPTGRNYPVPEKRLYIETARAFQAAIVTRYKLLTEELQKSVEGSAAFSASGACSIILPTATPPNEESFGSSPSAFGSYKELKPLLDSIVQQ